MKILNITFVLLLSFMALTGCYDDKGNYTYKEINRIEIGKLVGNGQAFTVGDTISINPELTFSEAPSDTLDLKYEWRFAGKTREGWDKKKFFWITDTVGGAYLEFRITDTKSGMVYLREVAIKLNSKYNAFGWMVLADKDNKSSLSYIKEFEVENEETSKKVFANIVYQDVYETENNGEILGHSPLKIHMHFCQDKSIPGQVMIVQGSAPYMIDLSGNTLKKEITIDQAFVNQTLPSDFRPVNTLSMRWVDLIENYDGKIYSRIKGTDELFHSSAYLPDPIQFEDKVLEKCHLVLAKFMSSGCAIVYDEKNNRLLSIMDNVEYGTTAGAGKVQVLPARPNTGSVEGWVPLDNLGNNKVIHIGYFYPKSSGQKIGIFMILQDQEGQYWTQEFKLRREYDTDSYYLEECKRVSIDLAPIIKENSVIYALTYQSASEFVLISSGPDIYLFDRTSPEDKIKHFYTCEGNVTCIEAERYRHRHAAVGTDNGSLVILNMEKAKNLETKEEKVIWESPANINFGKIVDVRFKTLYGNDWN